MPRISQILTALGIILSVVVIVVLYRLFTLPSPYDFLPKEDEAVKTWTPPEYDVPNSDAKG